VSYLVSTDQLGTQPLKDAGYFTFPGANATSQADDNHIHLYFRNN
jgi:hypothetical protein